MRVALGLAALAIASASAAGAWQQRCDFEIRVRFEPSQRMLEGTARVVYFNRSPDTLSWIPFHLHANAIRPGSAMDSAFQRDQDWTLARLGPDAWGECTLESATSGGIPLEVDARGALARVTLPHPLAPGDSTRIELEFHGRVPGVAIHSGPGAGAIHVGEWYPKPCVYDSEGWHTRPWTGRGEFYADFGDYDVELTLPATWLVAHTGTLLNPGEVLAPDACERLAGAGERAVRVLDGASAPDSLRESVRTWRVHARGVHDFAFSVSRAWRWDAVMRNGIGIHVLRSRRAAPEWDSAASFAADVITSLESRLGPLRDSSLTIVEAPGLRNSVEKPGLVWIAPPPRRGGRSRRLWQVLAHELAHQWFYALAGNDEAAEAWLDEGFATYLALGEMERAFGPGDNRFAWVRPLDRRWLNPDGFLDALVRDVEDWESAGRVVPVLTHSDSFPTQSTYVHAVYQRSALMLVDLERRFGRAPFDSLLQQYAQRWSGAHPDTRAFESEFAGSLAPPTGYFDRWLRSRAGAPALAGWGVDEAGRDRPAAFRMDNGIPPFDERRPGRLTVFGRPSASFNDVDGISLGAALRTVSPGGGSRFSALARVPPGVAGEHFRPLVELGAERRWGGRCSGALGARWLRGEGRGHATLEGRARYAPREGAMPAWSGSLFLERMDLFHAEYLRTPGGWDPGIETAAGLRLGAETAGARGRARVNVEARAGGQGDARFTRFQATLHAAPGMPGATPFRVRIFAGAFAHSGEAIPTQELFRLAGAGPIAEYDNALLRSRGLAGPSAHAGLDGGAGVRGYVDADTRGSRYVAASAEWVGPDLVRPRAVPDESPLPASLVARLRPRAFVDVGRLSGPAPDLEGGITRADAGPALEALSGLWGLAARFELPLWLSHPPGDERSFQWRWRLSLGAGE